MHSCTGAVTHSSHGASGAVSLGRAIKLIYGILMQQRSICLDSTEGSLIQIGDMMDDFI